MSITRLGAPTNRLKPQTPRAQDWAVLVSSCITPKARAGAASAIEGRGLFAVSPITCDELVAIKGTKSARPELVDDIGRA